MKIANPSISLEGDKLKCTIVLADAAGRDRRINGVHCSVVSTGPAGEKLPGRPIDILETQHLHGDVFKGEPDVTVMNHIVVVVPVFTMEEHEIFAVELEVEGEKTVLEIDAHPINDARSGEIPVFVL